MAPERLFNLYCFSPELRADHRDFSRPPFRSVPFLRDAGVYAMVLAVVFIHAVRWHALLSAFELAFLSLAVLHLVLMVLRAAQFHAALRDLLVRGELEKIPPSSPLDRALGVSSMMIRLAPVTALWVAVFMLFTFTAMRGK
jgi:hypothetical protein